jgi:diacylglycerol kinase (ATP)
VLTVLCVLNPTAGRGGRRLTDKVVALLQERGAEVILRETQARGDAELLARAAADHDKELGGGKIDVIAVAGGDGTINEVANGLLGSDIAIAVIPSGTANVLAQEIGLKANAEQVVETILNGLEVALRPGIVNGRCFVAMVGVGFDARIVAAMKPAQKEAIGKGAYALAGFPVFFGPLAGPFHVEIDGDVFEAAWVVVSKTHYYAGRYVIAPGASLSGPSLRIFLLKTTTKSGLLRALLAIAAGCVRRAHDVNLVDGKSVKITRLIHGFGESQAPEPVQADGDPAGFLPVEITVASQSVKILTPLES